MQEITKRAVEKLLNEGHLVGVVEAFDDIQELDKIAERVVNQTQSERRLLNQPFELCGIAFYPLTVAKSLWYAEKVRDWEIEGLFQDALLFWLLTLPLNDAALDTYSTRKEADRAILKLSRRLHCTQPEMNDVFRKCVGITAQTSATSTDGNGEQKPVDYGATIAVLLREYGGTPNQWLYETPIEVMGSLIDKYAAKIADEQSANAKASGKTAGHSPAKLAALRDFRIKLNEIKKKWKA